MTKKSTPRKALAELKAEYLKIELIAKRFSDELVRQLQILIDEEKVYLGFPVEARIKSWESISEKLQRLPHLKLDSINDLQDLIGVRLIFLFQRDSQKFCKRLSQTFTVLKQEDTQARLKEDQFGYTSIHFVVKFPTQWLVVPALSSFCDFKAEIQIRTVAQHLWAAAAHILQYKNEENIPEPVRRSIHRVSALLEIVDLEFERVLSDRSAYRQELTQKKPGETLNTDSLEFVLDTLLPSQNKNDYEEYEELLTEIRNFDINTPDALTELINNNLPVIMKKEVKAVRENIKALDEFSADEVERLKQGVFFTHSGLVRFAMENQFKERWKQYYSSKLCEALSDLLEED